MLLWLLPPLVLLPPLPALVEEPPEVLLLLEELFEELLDDEVLLPPLVDDPPDALLPPLPPLPVELLELSSAHRAEQPSPLLVFPSSHCSPDSRIPLPHKDGHNRTGSLGSMSGSRVMGEAGGGDSCSASKELNPTITPSAVVTAHS